MNASPDHGPAPAGRAAGRRSADDLACDRTHLANERTYAAWLRTGLSVAAGGIVVARLVPAPARGSEWSLFLGGTFVLLGIGLVVYGARTFAARERRLSLDRNRPIRAAAGGAYALTVVIGVLLVAVLFFLWSHRGAVTLP